MTRSMLALLRLYKLVLSPAISALGIHCRYTPTCSDYAADAVRKHGAWLGFWMTLARVQRCHPVRALGGSSGVDNVPALPDKPSALAPWKAGVWRHEDPHADADLS